MYKDVILWHQQLEVGGQSCKRAQFLYVIEVKLI